MYGFIVDNYIVWISEKFIKVHYRLKSAFDDIVAITVTRTGV